MSYRYTIRSTKGTREIIPLGQVNHTISYEKKSEDNIRDYEISFKGDLILTGESFHYLMEIENSTERCQLIEIDIDRRCGRKWKNIFAGVFSLNDATWNIDDCVVNLIESKQNKYECYDLNKGEEIDLFKISHQKKTVYFQDQGIEIETVFYYHTLFGEPDPGEPYYPIEVPVWDGPGTPEEGKWMSYDHNGRFVLGPNVNDPDDPIDPGGPGEPGGFGNQTTTRQTRWARLKKEINANDNPGVGWELLSTDGTTSIYIKEPMIVNCQISQNQVFGLIDGASTLLEAYHRRECEILGFSSGLEKLNNGLFLNDVLENIVQKFCPALTVKSKFLGINENTNGINYVTGENSKTEKIVLFQKSDVKRPLSSSLSTKMMSKWEFLMDNLKTMFNLEWRIEGDTLLIEHVSFFSKNRGIDINKAEYRRFFKNIYSYKNDELPRREVWNVKEYGGSDFRGTPILYETCNTADEETYNVEITTDVIHVMNHPDPDSKYVDDEGIVMIATEERNGQLYILSEEGILSDLRINNTLAIAQLMRDYHQYERPQINGILNDEETTFKSTKPIKEGQEFSIPLCCSVSFNPDDYITTKIGEGIVESATYNFKNETMELKLVYPILPD